MALASETVARTYLDIAAGVPINIPIPAFEASDVYVYYGNNVLAVQNVDYTVALDEDFESITVTPLASLITKMDNASLDYNITVRRTLDFLTEATPGGVRNTNFTSREFDRNAMRDLQLAEALQRSLKFGDVVDGAEVDVTVQTLEADRTLVMSPDGRFVVSGPTVGEVADAQNQAVAAGNSANAAAASASAASGSAAAAAADRVQTGLDRTATAADLVQTDLDTQATAADRVQTGLDRIATAADRVQTGLDRAVTTADRAQTGLDAAATASDRTFVANTYDAFDDRYLGAKASDPTVDNDGNALLTGALYWNTTSNEMRVWSGSLWLTAYLPASDYQVVTPLLTSFVNLDMAGGEMLFAFDANTIVKLGTSNIGRGFLGINSTAAGRAYLGLGDLATFDAMDFFKDQATWNAGTDTGQGTISPEQLDTKVGVSLAGFASGAAGEPRVQGIALGGLSLGYVTQLATNPAGFVGLDGVKTVIAFTNWNNPGSSRQFQIQFTNDNGATWGGFQNILPANTPVSTEQANLRIFRLNLVTGAYVLSKATADAPFSGTVTPLAGCNGFRIRGNTSSMGFSGDFYVVEGI